MEYLWIRIRANLASLAVVSLRHTKSIIVARDNSTVPSGERSATVSVFDNICAKDSADDS